MDTTNKLAEERLQTLAHNIDEMCRDALRIPYMPWPDPHAHSADAYHRAVHRSFCDLRFKLMDIRNEATAAQAPAIAATPSADQATQPAEAVALTAGEPEIDFEDWWEKWPFDGHKNPQTKGVAHNAWRAGKAVRERLIDCPNCLGDGRDGDVDDYGRMVGFDCHQCGGRGKILGSVHPAPASASDPDMRAICEALGFDPTNHHNAAKCPYCRPATEPDAPRATDKELAKLDLGYVQSVLRWSACGYVHTPERIAGLHNAYRVVTRIIDERASANIAGAGEALTELVALKDLKERIKAFNPQLHWDAGQVAQFHAMQHEYERRQPLAWAAARAALSARPVAQGDGEASHG